MLSARTAELETSNRELEQFAHVVSHDLREPLRTIKSFLSLIASRHTAQLNPEGLEFIGFAVDGAARMDAMIRSLLEYSRLHGTAERKPVDLEVLLSEVLHDLRSAIQESAARIHREPLPTVLGDRTRLYRALLNLVANAIKFVREGPPRVAVGSRREADQQLLWVRDEGIGLAPEDAERIFDPGQRLHGVDAFEGTGMGLAIERRIAAQHGGRA